MLGNRVCVARSRHPGFHNYTPLAKPGKADSLSLRQYGVRERSIIQKVSFGEDGLIRDGGVRVEKILENGVIVGRTLATGRVLSLNADRVIAKYRVTRR